MKISIIITSFNSAKYLRQSIQSVLDQTHLDFELIIVDDCSTDSSRELIKKFQKKDNRIRHIFLKKNSGTASIPRNMGIKASKGKYICFLDADDIWEKTKLFEQIKSIKKNTIISFTSCYYIKENGQKYSSYLQDFTRQYLQKIVIKNGLKALFAYNPIILSSVLVKKNIIQKYYFDTSKSIVGVEDLDLWLRILFDISIKNISFCEKKLVKIRRTSNSLNINYTQASLRNTYCVMRFFLEKKLMKNFQFFLFGIILRSIKNLIKVYEVAFKKNFIKLIAIFAFFYFTIFYSPLFWYIGNNLVFYDKPKLTNTLIVLSGNGNADYINTGYQRRYLDTKILLKKKNFNKIILMGRAQEIEESEILRSLLTFDGIKKNKILLINKTFGNTKENISSLKDILLEQGIDEANFLTSPYHSKRSRLLWNNHSKKVKIYITKNSNNPKNEVKWSFDYKEIKVILYETMAIFYNKLRGWI